MSSQGQFPAADIEGEVGLAQAAAVGKTISINCKMFVDALAYIDVEMQLQCARAGALAKSRRKSGVTDAFSGPVASVSLALLALKHNLFL